jgi:hypothetical protein
MTIWRLLGLWTATSVPVSLVVGTLLARQEQALATPQPVRVRTSTAAPAHR